MLVRGQSAQRGAVAPSSGTNDNTASHPTSPDTLFLHHLMCTLMLKTISVDLFPVCFGIIYLVSHSRKFTATDLCCVTTTVKLFLPYNHQMPFPKLWCSTNLLVSTVQIWAACFNFDVQFFCLADGLAFSLYGCHSLSRPLVSILFHCVKATFTLQAQVAQIRLSHSHDLSHSDRLSCCCCFFANQIQSDLFQPDLGHFYMWYWIRCKTELYKNCNYGIHATFLSLPHL